MLVGGSGLYVQAVLELRSSAPTRRCVGREPEAELDRVGRALCTAGWPDVDPAAAAEVLPSNGRWIVRAWR
ncbi:hypothetical protein HBB16_03260 [Pseudonocardia sp. MCCB 268]|nr:hypothetical protein [Pseudonocardia cytotoxica]